MQKPHVSVLLPVYNAERYLIDSVASIIEQSIRDWELICVNDGSTDQSPRMLEWFAQQDDRIRIVHQENQGLVGALNEGIKRCRGDLIMRMDNDDIAMRDRMKHQVRFMQEHPDCVVVGCGILEMDSEGDPLNVTRRCAIHDHIVDDLLHRRTGHFHPTTMIRADVLRSVGGYRSEYEWVEDHDLWLRLSERGELANMPEILLCYRQHASSICWQRSSQQRELMNRLLKEAYARREREIPANIILSESKQRSAAGPGKWARAAARGGFFRTARKHLSSLNQSDAARMYKLRMNLEVLARASRQRLTSSRYEKQQPKVPRFADWHRRWNAFQESVLETAPSRAAEQPSNAA